MSVRMPTHLTIQYIHQFIYRVHPFELHLAWLYIHKWFVMEDNMYVVYMEGCQKLNLYLTISDVKCYVSYVCDVSNNSLGLGYWLDIFLNFKRT